MKPAERAGVEEIQIRVTGRDDNGETETTTFRLVLVEDPSEQAEEAVEEEGEGNQPDQPEKAAVSSSQKASADPGQPNGLLKQIHTLAPEPVSEARANLLDDLAKIFAAE